MLTFRDLLLSAQEPLRSALSRMTGNRKGILFVCDAGDHLVGVLSDGDVRRSLLDDTLSLAPVSKAMNIDPLSAPTPEEARRLIRATSVLAVPVVDGAGRITSIVVQEPGGIAELRPPEPVDATKGSGVEKPGLAIIPARGGSKRIPRKNLAVIGGKSLLEWAILAAHHTPQVGRILVSTDDPVIADAARALGVEIPWLRPSELSRDRTSTLDVLLHAATWAREYIRPAPTVGLLLEPSAPLRRAEQLERALSMLEASEADSVVSVCRLPHVFHPDEVMRIDDGFLRPHGTASSLDTRRLRQEQTPAYVASGAVYAFRLETLLQTRSLYGERTLPLETPWEEFLDIDEPEDLRRADTLLTHLGFTAGGKVT